MAPSWLRACPDLILCILLRLWNCFVFFSGPTSEAEWCSMTRHCSEVQEPGAPVLKPPKSTSSIFGRWSWGKMVCLLEVLVSPGSKKSKRLRDLLSKTTWPVHRLDPTASRRWFSSSCFRPIWPGSEFSQNKLAEVGTMICHIICWVTAILATASHFYTLGCSTGTDISASPCLISLWETCCSIMERYLGTSTPLFSDSG